MDDRNALEKQIKPSAGPFIPPKTVNSLADFRLNKRLGPLYRVVWEKSKRDYNPSRSSAEVEAEITHARAALKAIDVDLDAISVDELVAAALDELVKDVLVSMEGEGWNGDVLEVDGAKVHGIPLGWVNRNRSDIVAAVTKVESGMGTDIPAHIDRLAVEAHSLPWPFLVATGMPSAEKDKPTFVYSCGVVEAVTRLLGHRHGVVMKLKRKIQLPRPTEATWGKYVETPWIAVPNHSSFPGGHAATAYALAGILTALTKAEGLQAIAAQVAKGREELGLHTHLDSQAGQALGGVVGGLLIAAKNNWPHWRGLLAMAGREWVAPAKE